MRVAILPNPEPRELVLRIGPESEAGHEIMLKVKEPKGEGEADPYFVFCRPQWVPQEAWTGVPLFGKLAGKLLNPEAVRPGGLLSLAPAPAPPQKAP